MRAPPSTLHASCWLPAGGLQRYEPQYEERARLDPDRVPKWHRTCREPVTGCARTERRIRRVSDGGRPWLAPALSVAGGGALRCCLTTLATWLTSSGHVGANVDYPAYDKMVHENGYESSGEEYRPGQAMLGGQSSNSPRPASLDSYLPLAS